MLFRAYFFSKRYLNTDIVIKAENFSEALSVAHQEIIEEPSQKLVKIELVGSSRPSIEDVANASLGDMASRYYEQPDLTRKSLTDMGFIPPDQARVLKAKAALLDMIVEWKSEEREILRDLFKLVTETKDDS